MSAGVELRRGPDRWLACARRGRSPRRSPHERRGQQLTSYHCCGGVRTSARSTRVYALVLLLLFLVAPVSCVALSAAAQESQARKTYRIGFLRAGQPPTAWVEAFQQGLRELGYIAGKNVVIEFRFTDGGYDQLPQLAGELVRLKVDVIVASGAPAALAAQNATTSVPVVFAGVTSPVEIGLITHLGRPGGNITGWPSTLLISPGSALSYSGNSCPSSGESLSSGTHRIPPTRYSSRGRRSQRAR